MDIKELKEWRARHKLTQAQLAALLGLSVDTYRGWEQGKSWPSGDLLPLALEALERHQDASD